MLKTIFAFVLISSSAFAGQACFQADSQVPSYIPKQICLDNLTVEQFSSHYFVTVDGGIAAGRYLARAEAQSNSSAINLAFRSNLFSQVDAGCGFGQIIDAIVKVQSANGQIAMDSISVSVEVSETADSCHQDATSRVISYSRL